MLVTDRFDEAAGGTADVGRAAVGGPAATARVEVTESCMLYLGSLFLTVL